MSQSHKVKKPKSLGMLAGVMSMGLMSAPASQAGQWKLQSVTGATGSKTTVLSQNQFNSSEGGYYFPAGGYAWSGFVQSDGTGLLSAGSSDYSVGTTKAGSTIVHKNTGSGTATFVWEAMQNGRPDGSPPAQWLYVEVETNARATALSHVPSGPGLGSPAADSAEVELSIRDETITPLKWLSDNSQTRNAEASSTTKRLLRFASNGQSSVDVPLGALTATATGSNAGAGNSGQYTYVSTIFGYAVKPGYRGIAIYNSRIEESFKKGTRPVDRPELTLYQQPNVRASDGSIVTDSAVQWYESPDGSFKGWLGGGPFSAPAIGISTPTYTWSVEGGQSRRADNGSDPSQYDLTPAPSNEFTPWYGVLAGSQADASDLIGSSTVKVKATDSSDGAVAENTFAVNWHTPYEDWELVNTSPAPNLDFPKLGFAVDSNNEEYYSHEPNRTIHFEIPPPEIKFNLKSGLSTGSIFLGAAGGTAAIWTGALGVGVGALAPEITLALTATAGIASIASGAMPASTSDTKESDYAQYKADLSQQKLINDARAVDPDAYPDQDVRCGDPAFVNAAIAEIDRVESLSNPSWENDTYFVQSAGSLRCEAKAGRYQRNESWRGDEYDSYGYAGPAPLELTKPQSVFYVFNWTYTPPTPQSGL